MGILGKKSKLTEAPKIRIESVPVDRKPKPKPVASSSSSSLATRKRSAPSLSSRPGSNRVSPSPSSASSIGAASRKRKTLSSRPARPSPSAERVDFGRESESEEEEVDTIAELEKRRRAKRGRLSDGKFEDLDRCLTSREAFEAGTKTRKLIHAKEVASLRHPKCEPLLGAKEDEVAVELQYPSLQPRERFELVRGKDMIDAVHSVISVVRHVAETYLTDDQAEPFLDHTKGLVRRLEKASSSKINDLLAFKAALAEYNDKVLGLVEAGTISKNLDKIHSLPRTLVDFILDQVYDRTVAPKVELLSKYENGTDNVYGELLHPFVSKILVEQLQMTSGQVFVDLGSGVGNVVIQAALEVGCESWGCEMMENACNLADAQDREFGSRCLLWGLAPGKVRLERGDFRKCEPILEALKRADVVLVNNQAFTSQLNDDLVRMFLDLKSGCKIVSLKTFVHDHKTTSNDLGRTILDVEQLTYPQDYVSWTNAGGTYCISTRK